jgi:hypothetical protein
MIGKAVDCGLSLEEFERLYHARLYRAALARSRRRMARMRDDRRG